MIWPKFSRVKSRNQFTDGFMISNCSNIYNKDLKTLLLSKQVDVNCIITTKVPGNKWVMLKDGHH